MGNIFCRDKAAIDLLAEVMKLSGSKTKSDALVTALRHEVERLSNTVSPSERIAGLQKRVAEL